MSLLIRKHQQRACIMKNVSMHRLMIAVVLCMTLAAHSFGQGNRHKTKVRFDFKPELTIDRSNCPKDDFFRRIADVKTDAKGNIYILDDYSCRIWKFDSSGKYLFSFGREGTGNKEFESPSDLIVDSRDNLYVLDGRLKRVSAFDPNGKFIRSFKVDLLLTQFELNGVLGSNDQVILRGYKHGKIFHVYDTFGNYIRSFGEPAHPSEPGRYINNERYLALGTTFCSNGVLLSTNRYTYEIRKYDATTGKLLGRITRSFPRWREPVLHIMPQGGSALDAAFPGYVSVVTTIELKQGEIVNFLAVSQGAWKFPVLYIDIFSKDGKWLGLYDVNYAAYAIDREGKIYCVPWTGSGDWKVMRCSLGIKVTGRR